MGHAAGEPADGLHLLGLAELGLQLRARFFGLLARGDILGLDDEVQRAGSGVADQRHADQGPDDAPTLVKVAFLLLVPASLASRHRPVMGDIGPSFVGMRHVLEGDRQQLGFAVAEEVTERVVDAEVPAIGLLERRRRTRDRCRP